MSEFEAIFVSRQENFALELNKAVASSKTFDAIVVDLDDDGKLTLANMAYLMSVSARLLNGNGTLLLLSDRSAITFAKDEITTGLIGRSFDSPKAVLSRFPLLGSFLISKLPGLKRMNPEIVGSIFEHILSSLIPLETGRQVPYDRTARTERNLVLSVIDGVTSVEQLALKLQNGYGMPKDRVMAGLESLERMDVIYPVFTRADFLANCYKSKKPFRLGHYMVASGVLSEGQLQVCLEKQAETEETSGRKPLLGELVVKAGLVSTPLLNHLLEDQFFFSGAQARTGAGNSQPLKSGAMIGSLSTIDAPALLQSLSSASKDGLLIVENQNRTAQIKFENGRPTSASLSDLFGDNAVLEFLHTFADGTFVFRDQDANKQLSDECTLQRPLAKLLMDGALTHDIMLKIYSELPAKNSTIVERQWNFEALWKRLDCESCPLMDETVLTAEEWNTLEELAFRIDGMGTVEQIVEDFRKWPQYLSVMCIHMMIQQGLLVPNQSILSEYLNKFCILVDSVEAKAGAELNEEILVSSLRSTFKPTDAILECMRVGPNRRPQLNLPRIREKGLSISNVVDDINRWMHTYVAYCQNLNIETQVC